MKTKGRNVRITRLAPTYTSVGVMYRTDKFSLMLTPGDILKLCGERSNSFIVEKNGFRLQISKDDAERTDLDLTTHPSKKMDMDYRLGFEEIYPVTVKETGETLHSLAENIDGSFEKQNLKISSSYELFNGLYLYNLEDGGQMIYAKRESNHDANLTFCKSIIDCGDYYKIETEVPIHTIYTISKEYIKDVVLWVIGPNRVLLEVEVKLKEEAEKIVVALPTGDYYKMKYPENDE